MAEDAGARAKQLGEYRKKLAALRAETDRAVDFVGTAFWGPELTFSYKDATRRTKVERFLSLMGLAEVEKAARIAFARFPKDGFSDDRFRYFCGVCWNRCTELGIRGTPDAE